LLFFFFFSWRGGREQRKKNPAAACASASPPPPFFFSHQGGKLKGKKKKETPQPIRRYSRATTVDLGEGGRKDLRRGKKRFDPVLAKITGGEGNGKEELARPS